MLQPTSVCRLEPPGPATEADVNTCPCSARFVGESRLQSPCLVSAVQSVPSAIYERAETGWLMFERGQECSRARRVMHLHGAHAKSES